MKFRWLMLLTIAFALIAQTPPASTIRFEDATAASGIQFTHSFGAQKLGSLLEGTGAGCVWFDYNNDGLLDLYVASGSPLGGNPPVSAEENAGRNAAQPSLPERW